MGGGGPAMILLGDGRREVGGSVVYALNERVCVKQGMSGGDNTEE